MTGMDTVIDLRRAGRRPGAVFVRLVDLAPRDPYALSSTGNVAIDIARADSLATIDFRPLVGLTVVVSDHADDRARHRKVAALIAAVEPALLVMSVTDGDTYCVHRRWAATADAPARTETLLLGAAP